MAPKPSKPHSPPAETTAATPPPPSSGTPTASSSSPPSASTAIYQSADGITWTRATHQPGAALTTTACPTNPNSTGSPNLPHLPLHPRRPTRLRRHLRALTVDINNNDQGLYQDACTPSGSACTNATLTFAIKIPTTILESSGTIPQGDYDLSLAASPATAGDPANTILYAGAIDLYRCTFANNAATGCLFRNTTNALNGCNAPAQVAPAQHTLAALSLTQPPALPRKRRRPLAFHRRRSPDRHCLLRRRRHPLPEPQRLPRLPRRNHLPGLPTPPTPTPSSSASEPTEPPSPLPPPPYPLASTRRRRRRLRRHRPDQPKEHLRLHRPRRQHHLLRQGQSACTAADFAGQPTLGPSSAAGEAALIDAPYLLDPALTSRRSSSAPAASTAAPRTTAIELLPGQRPRRPFRRPAQSPPATPPPTPSSAPSPPGAR